MTIFRMPEGVELDLKVYIVGIVEGQEAEIMITVGGLPAFTDSVNKELELGRIIESHDLASLGHSWRVMTREEIRDYKRREREGENVDIVAEAWS